MKTIYIYVFQIACSDLNSNSKNYLSKFLLFLNRQIQIILHVQYFLLFIAIMFYHIYDRIISICPSIYLTINVNQTIYLSTSLYIHLSTSPRHACIVYISYNINIINHIHMFSRSLLLVVSHVLSLLSLSLYTN